MGHYWFCAILFRVVLPFVICTAAYVRPTITSYIYLLMGLYLPFFSVPTFRTMLGPTCSYLKMLLVVCILINAYVISFFFSLFFPTGEDYQIAPCSPIEKFLRTAGVVDFQNLPTKDAICWYLPEPLMLVTSLGLFVLFKKLNRYDEIDLTNDEIVEALEADQLHQKKLKAIFLNFGKYLVVFWFCVAAVIRPSIQGVIYYLVFLIVMTYWACNRSLGKVYARILVFLAPIISAHLSIIYLYQLQYFQDNEHINSTSFFGRLFQLVSLFTYKDCQDPRLFQLHEQTSLTHAFPGILFILYHLAVLVSRQILEAKDGLTATLAACLKREKESVSKWRKAFSQLKKQMQQETPLHVKQNMLADIIRNMVEQIIQSIIRSSYLVANFTMMVWAISYISWKGLLLLMWANLIWLLPARRKIMLFSSPFLVAYVWFLLGTNYMYSMQLDIRRQFGGLNLSSGSHVGENLMWTHLLIKSLFAVIIFITMRQFFQERALRRTKKTLDDAMDLNAVEPDESNVSQIRTESKTWRKIRGIANKWIALCWIWVVIITLIWMDFMSTSNPFRIMFVALAIVAVMTFQICPFNCWKKFMRVYWWIVIIYAMFNLLILYMYQMTMTRRFLHTYFYGEKIFKRFGFKYEPTYEMRLFILANPLFLQIAIVIQKNYVQTNFDKYTSPESPEELEEQRKELDEIHRYVRTVITIGTNAKNFFFALLEIHLYKVIILVGWFLCCFDLCAMFFPFVLLLTASCIFGRLFTWVTIHLMSFFVEILILVRLVYMNQYTAHNSWDYVGYYERNGLGYNRTLNTAMWLGFRNSEDPDYADIWHMAWCFLFVFMVTLDKVVHLRQMNYKISRNMSTARQRVLFPEINSYNCHDSTKSMIKFLVNYGFYKLGIELTTVVAVIVLAIRMDAAAIVIALGVLMTFSLSRKWLERILLPVLILVAAWLPFQYAMSLGFWPTHWEKSPTRFWNENDFKVRFQQFFHLMNMAHPPPKEMVICDFILLMCLSRQWRTFRVMRKFGAKEFGAGSNENVGDMIDLEEIDNPVPDFITYSRNFLDIYKNIFFHFWFYISLLVTFLAGTMRPTVYSFGYILAAFALMWEGSDMYLKHPKSILFRWNMLIFFNVTILVFRTTSQLFGCILIYDWADINCKLYSMFNVVCVDRFGMTDGIPNMADDAACPEDFDPVGLQWDCACFFFLIIQQRIFKSFHFFHIINDAKAQTYLASRGAQLIEDQKQKKRQAYENLDASIRASITKRLQRIEDNKQKIQGDVYLRRKKNHKHMLRSGDYFLFDDVERSLDIPLMPPKQEDVDSEFDPYDPMPFYEYVNCILTTGMDGVLAERALRQRQKQAVIEGKKPEDLKKALVRRQPRAGTSNQPPPPVKEELSTVRKLMNILLFLWGLMESIVVSLTIQFNHMTRDFRFILNEIDKDRKLLKETTNYSQGIRVGWNKIWKPLATYSDLISNSAKEQKTEKGQKIRYSLYAKLLKSIWCLGVNQSEWLCYLTIITYQMVRPQFIAVPLPMMVFCWGALTVPKPTKTFWVAIISHVLILQLTKNFFVMEVVDWNKHTFTKNLFYPPSIIGISRYINSFIGLTLMCPLFFHRVVLQWLGLWESVTYRTSSLIEDGDYNLIDGKFVIAEKNEARKKNTIMNIKSLGISMGDYFPNSIPHGAGKYAEGFRLFMQQLISPSSTQVPVDVYTPMFCCDLINLLLIVFFYYYFESTDSEHIEEDEGMGLIQYFENNRVPVMYICVIVVYFMMIVLDRWIYLRRNRFAKLVYHFFQVTTIHLWAFVLYPLLTGRLFVDTLVVQMFYVFKCFYFLFSAYQIRNGYPRLISGLCISRGTTLYNRFLFKTYRIIPYIFELRTLLDWTCTDTSLGVLDWFKMQEINDSIYDQKCQQDFEALMNDSGGERKSRTTKYFLGGIMFAILFFTLVFPFFLFSLGSSVGVTTHPAKLTLELYMGSTEPIFNSYAAQKSLVKLQDHEYHNLTRTFNNIQASESLFGAFNSEDVVVVKWSSHSLTSWVISPGSLKEMIEEVRNYKDFGVRVLIRYTHVGSGGEKTERAFGQSTIIPELPNPVRQGLIDMLVNGTSDQVVWIPLVFPKFLMITKEAKPRALPIMEEPKNDGEEKYQDNLAKVLRSEKDDDEEDDDDDEERSPKRLRNLLLALQRENGQLWWQIQEECNTNDDNYMYYLKDLVHNSCEELVIYTFNEKVFSRTMYFITESGILGLYFIYFMLVYGIIRSIMIDVSEIWIEDLPNADRLFRKCNEVYIARDMENFELEEELFAELIFIMRSREICIKLTRYEDDPYNPTYITPGTKRKS